MLSKVFRNALFRRFIFGSLGLLFLGALLFGFYSGISHSKNRQPAEVQFGISVRNGDVGKQLRDARSLSKVPVGSVTLDFFWDDDFPFDAVQFISNKRAIPFLRWYPMMSDSFDTFSFHSILEGTWDSQIQRWAQRARESQFPIVIALFSGFNREEMGLEEVGMQSKQFVDSTRYVIKKFQDEKASNVTFVWDISNDGMVIPFSELSQFYPGDDFVDWVGVSIAYTPVNSFRSDFQELIANGVPTENDKPILLTVSDIRPFEDSLRWANEGILDVLATENLSIKALVLDVPEGFLYQKLNPIFSSDYLLGKPKYR